MGTFQRPNRHTIDYHLVPDISTYTTYQVVVAGERDIRCLLSLLRLERLFILCLIEEDGAVDVDDETGVHGGVDVGLLLLCLIEEREVDVSSVGGNVGCFLGFRVILLIGGGEKGGITAVELAAEVSDEDGGVTTGVLSSAVSLPRFRRLLRGGDLKWKPGGSSSSPPASAGAATGTAAAAVRRVDTVIEFNKKC